MSKRRNKNKTSGPSQAAPPPTPLAEYPREKYVGPRDGFTNCEGADGLRYYPLLGPAAPPTATVDTHRKRPKPSSGDELSGDELSGMES